MPWQRTLRTATISSDTASVHLPYPGYDVGHPVCSSVNGVSVNRYAGCRMSVLHTIARERSNIFFFVLQNASNWEAPGKETPMTQNHERGEHNLMTCEEAATCLRLRVRTVGRLLAQGKLPGVKVGRQ